MTSGILFCQRCGGGNKYARWVGGEFKEYETLVCDNCGFLIYDKYKSYQVRKSEYENKKNEKAKRQFDKG